LRPSRELHPYHAAILGLSEGVLTYWVSNICLVQWHGGAWIRLRQR
jgi:hypothetical protein